MSKILGSWSGMRKYLEQDMLAPSLQGRIRYECKSYHFKLFEVYIDSNLVKQFSWETTQKHVKNNTQLYDKNIYGNTNLFGSFKNIPISVRTEYSEDEFCDALKDYRQQSIQDSISSDNPIVRMFAILDRRLGKRTLENLSDKISEQPLWLQQFYKLRIDAETQPA